MNAHLTRITEAALLQQLADSRAEVARLRLALRAAMVDNPGASMAAATALWDADHA